jgi:nuclear pore complex protein Nup98-Nup96
MGRKSYFGKEHVRPLKSYAQSTINKSTPPVVRDTSFPLLEYEHGNIESDALGSILMVQ